MTHIQTVTGLFPVEKLERVLMHEHIVLGYAGWFYDPAYAHFDHDRAERQTLTRLQQLRDLGVNLVVDPCPMELGRNPDFMQEMSVKSGVQIMCSTGFDLQARGYLSAFRTASAEEIRDIYLAEIKEAYRIRRDSQKRKSRLNIGFFGDVSITADGKEIRLEERIGGRYGNHGILIRVV